MPAREEMPATLRRSSAQARRTWSAAHDAAVQEYGEGERSHRTAFAALKRGFEKVGDHWEAKPGGPGPSDPQAEQHGAPARDHPRATYEGVDANASKSHLMRLARRLDVRGRSTMTRAQLVEALRRANSRATARSAAASPR
jgi:ChaB